jgi:hypothetical protein
MAEWEHQWYGRDRDSNYEHDRGRMTHGGLRESREQSEWQGGYGRDRIQPWRQPGSHGGYQRPGYGREGSVGWAQQGGRFGGGQQGRPGGPYVGRGPKGYRRSDERIKEDVCEYLAQHGAVDASDIEVSVQDGEVTLSGTVDSRRVKRMAEETVESAGGVSEVHNRLRVRDVSEQSPLEQGRQFGGQGKRVDRA